MVYANAGVVQQSFASGEVQDYCCGAPNSGVFGGIAANNNGSFDNNGNFVPSPEATIATNVYWDKETTTRTVSVGTGTQLPAANGFTTAQMSTPASFDASWDFSPSETWVIPTGGTHPILRWQSAP